MTFKRGYKIIIKTTEMTFSNVEKAWEFISMLQSLGMTYSVQTLEEFKVPGE